jgi:hypothetical protein
VRQLEKGLVAAMAAGLSSHAGGLNGMMDFAALLVWKIADGRR